MSRKLEEKQQRRLAEERRREEQRRAALRRNLVTGGVAVAVLALVVGSIALQKRGEGSGGRVGVAAAQAGCGEIEEHEDLGRDHIEPGEQHDVYNSSPPTSGPHYGTPAETGFYSTPLPPEQLVHNLEHGQIVIWYSPDASQEIKDQLEEIVDQERLATVAAPYEGIEGSASFVLTGWTVSQSCARVSQEVIDDFREKYQGQGPEPITPPFEG